MRITVKGTNLDVTPQIRDEAIAKLSRVSRMFDRFIDMEVVFSEETNPRIEERVRCEATLHAKGQHLRASAMGPDPVTAISRTEAKLARQVRKLKTKLVSKPRREAAQAAPVAANAPIDGLTG
ncbi:MAG: ribosome-associated translation inhibitor RaiA [Nitriliruptoraceae bacterium]